MPSAEALPLRTGGHAHTADKSAAHKPADDLIRIRPRLPFAQSYGVTPANLVKALGSSSVRREVVAGVLAQAHAAGISDIEENVRLDAAMTMLAESLRGDELPALDVLDFLLESYGVVGPSPHLVISRASGTPPPGPDEASAELRRSITAQLASVLKDAGRKDLGVGIATTEKGVLLIVAVQSQLIRMSPLPRSWRSKKGRVGLDVTLLGAERKPEALVTTPEGKTHPLELTVTEKSGQARFHTSVGCDGGRGRYQLELMGRNPKSGNVVLANLPFFCDVAPPTNLPRSTAANHAVATDPQAAEERLASLVNEDRRRAGLPALVLDAAWSAVARAHSQEMAERNVVAHTSPATGTAVERAKKAGLSSQALLENLASATSPEEVEAGLMASPGHRQNILDPGVKRMGIGVAIRPPSAGGATLFVTQLFAAP